MAKVTEADRTKYLEEINIYKNRIEDISKKIKNNNVEIANNKTREPYLRIDSTNAYLNQISIYCGMNTISVYLLDVKNNSFLEKARLLIYEALMNLEKVVTNYIDVPFADYEEFLEKIADITDFDKLNLIKKLGFSIDLLVESFGENSKWKWSFVELESRFSVISKNFFDLKLYQKLNDPREIGYKERREHLKIIFQSMQSASQHFREKYEFTGKDIEDLKKAIDLQKGMLRVAQLVNDTEKLENCKKQIDVWSTLLEKKLIEDAEKKKNSQLR